MGLRTFSYATSKTVKYGKAFDSEEADTRPCAPAPQVGAQLAKRFLLDSAEWPLDPRICLGAGWKRRKTLYVRSDPWPCLSFLEARGSSASQRALSAAQTPREPQRPADCLKSCFSRTRALPFTQHGLSCRALSNQTRELSNQTLALPHQTQAIPHYTRGRFTQ